MSQEVHILKSTQIISSPVSVSFCGRYLAYITNHKVVVRKLETREYSIIYTKNLQDLTDGTIYSEKKALKNQNKETNLQQFLENNCIKSTNKTNLNDTSSLDDEDERDDDDEQHQITNGQRFQIYWKPSVKHCKELVVLDKLLQIVFMLNINNQKFSIIFKNNQFLKITHLQYINDSQYFVLYYDRTIKCEIYQISIDQNKPWVKKFELSSLKFPKFQRRSLIDDNAQMITFTTKSSTEENLVHFKIINQELVNLGKISNNSINEFGWSKLGKWYGSINWDNEVCLNNIFNLFPAKMMNFKYSGDVSLIQWGFLKRNNKFVDNNYDLLQEELEEIVIIGDINENITVLSTSENLKEILVMNNGNKVLNEENLKIWEYQEEISNYEFVYTCSDYYDFKQKSNEFNKGINFMSLDILTKVKTLSFLKSQKFQKKIISSLVSKQNLFVTNFKSSSNYLFIWNLNQDHKVPMIIKCLEPVRLIRWHPYILGVMMIMTASQISIWSSFSKEAPIIVARNVSQKLINVVWLPSIIGRKLRLVSYTKKEYQIIEFALTNDLFQSYKDFSKTISNKSPNEGENKWFVSEDEVDLNNTTNQMLIDDDTNAIKIINDAQKKDWLERISNIDEEDTFKFKKRRF